jgi:DNA-binding LacI/PurR family transcriptional regulator
VPNVVPLPAMPSLLLPPRREFLVDQVAAVLRREIAAGRWREWLPGERSLIKTFNVSRPTLRGALQQLVAARELVLYPRHGYRIGRGRTGRSQAAKPAATELGLICPELIYSMPAYVIQVVDLLRAMGAEAGLHLEIFEGRRFARTDPGRFMPQLVRSHPKACWIPIMADRRMQQWFARSGTPAVIYGNVYPELRLPAAGIDYHACLRHATTLLLAKGHHRIALVSYDLRWAGEQESLAGFREALRAGSHEDAVAFEVARPDDDVVALRRQVDRLLDLARPPTAFIVCRTHHYATVATRVLERGRRVPADVSLVCRGEDTFLHFLSPAPAFYRVNVELLARRLFRGVLRVVGGATQPDEQHRLVPQLVPGASLGAAPAAVA